MNGVDRLVAEKVMGWAYDGDVWQTRDKVDRYRPLSWSPSTIIGDAWEVYERVDENGEPILGSIVRCATTGGEWHYGVFAKINPNAEDDEEKEGYYWNKSAPMAICITALRTAGVPESEITAALNAKGKP